MEGTVKRIHTHLLAEIRPQSGNEIGTEQLILNQPKKGNGSVNVNFRSNANKVDECNVENSISSFHC